MKKNLNIIILGLAALSLSSCKTLYGKYERPDVKTSGIVRDVASDTDTLAVKDTTTFANIPWRSVFTDPQLQSLIEKGLNNNVNLLNAALNVKIAEEQLKCAKLAFLPALSFTPQGTIASWDGQAATKTYTMPVTASWMVDLFGNLLSQKRSAQMALLQLQDYQVSVKTNLIANIANMYYTLLMLDKQVELVNNMEGLTKDTWETMQKMHDLRLGYRTPAIQSAESNYYSVLTQKTDLSKYCDFLTECQCILSDFYITIHITALECITTIRLLRDSQLEAIESLVVKSRSPSSIILATNYILPSLYVR